MTKDNIYVRLGDMPLFKEMKMKERLSLLMQVDAIEKFLHIPHTSDARRFAKSNGWEQGSNVTYTTDLDVTEEKG